MDDESKCPVVHSTEGRSNRDWWPNQLDLKRLQQNPPMADPMGVDSTTPRSSRPSTSMP